MVERTCCRPTGHRRVFWRLKGRATRHSGTVVIIGREDGWMFTRSIPSAARSLGSHWQASLMIPPMDGIIVEYDINCGVRGHSIL